MKLNKKFIIISISVILILLIVLGIIIFNMFNKNVKKADDIIKTSESNIFDEKEFIDETNIMSENENNLHETDDEENIEEKTSIVETQEAVKIENNSNKHNKQIKENTQTKTVESKSKISNITENPSQSISTTNQNDSTQTTVITLSTPKEEFKRNDQMINKIKNIIQNNETDLMKTYGYTIVVDSSIKTLTNQFTFYENRVINSLRNKFGTIKIYAEDCYQNGQFIMTECYML